MAEKESRKSFWSESGHPEFMSLVLISQKIMKCTSTVKINSLPVAADRRATTTGNITVKGSLITKHCYFLHSLSAVFEIKQTIKNRETQCNGKEVWLFLAFNNTL